MRLLFVNHSQRRLCLFYMKSRQEDQFVVTDVRQNVCELKEFVRSVRAPWQLLRQEPGENSQLLARRTFMCRASIAMEHTNNFILRRDIRLGAVRVTKRLQKFLTSDCSSFLKVMTERHFGSFEADVRKQILYQARHHRIVGITKL